MSICHCGHSIDFKVLVGSNWGSLLDCSPVSERWLSIVEPFVAELLHVSGIKMCNSLCNFCPCHSAIKVQHLCTNLLHKLRSWLYRHQLIVKLISTPNNFYIIQVMTLNCWEGNPTVIHLSCKNLISKEPIAENSTVTVWTVETFLASDIWEIWDEWVHWVVLFLNIIQVSCYFIDLKISIYPL